MKTRSILTVLSPVITIILVLLAVFVVVLVLSGCTSAPVQNDGDHSYRSLKHVDVDNQYYHPTGTVIALPVMNEFTGVEWMPYRYLGADDQNHSPVHTMRLHLTKDLVGDLRGNTVAEAGYPVGLKVYGSTLNAILVAPQESFDADRALVLELENCRPLSPVVDEEPNGR
jgi:hypothetical protein